MSFRCSDTEARLIDAVDGRLDVPTQIRLNGHLEECATCRQRAGLWRQAVPALRALAPVAPADLNARRIQVEILRQLHADDAGPGGRAPNGGLFAFPTQRWRRWRLGALLALGLAGAAGVASGVLWLSKTGGGSGGTSPGGPGELAIARTAAASGTGVEIGTGEATYATVLRAVGDSVSKGKAVRAAARLKAGSDLVVAAGGETELLMDRGSVLRVFGPARLTLGGSAREVALRLDQGTLQADVAHRIPGETFSVITPDLLVDVRGTRFMVGTGHGTTARTGGWVRVQEGLVAVRFSDGRRRLVGEGEGAMAAAGVPDAAAAAPGATTKKASSLASSCGDALRFCQSAAHDAREQMRGGRHERALRLVTAAGRGLRGAGGCNRETTACEDELRYLRAEALRGAGRIDEAVAAYRSLNRPSGPPVMRQNALYAAAELERRSGRLREALADYARAMAAAPAPDGPLHEEALIGSIETAQIIGDGQLVAVLARRYLTQYPSGRAVARARRWAGRLEGEQPR